MSSAGLVNRFLKDSSGASLIAFTLVFPLVLLTALGTFDVAYMLWDWQQASKATYAGARRAIVLDPVALEATDLDYSASSGTETGELCFDPANGTPDPTSACPTVDTVCAPATSGGGCTNSYTWNETPFSNGAAEDSPLSGIFNQMQRFFPTLERQNVEIHYQTTGLGFVGRPVGLPMNVTVSIRCMTHKLYFLGPLMNWAFSAPAGCPAATGVPMPSFATTLTSEDMCRLDNCL